MPPVIPPTPDRDDDYFWAGVLQQRLLLQRCTACRSLRHPPVPMCARCHSTAWEPSEASGRGTVYSWIVSRHPTEMDAAPRIVVLVQLEEGPRIVCNLGDADAAHVRNDMAVELFFDEIDGVMLPQFRPSQDQR